MAAPSPLADLQALRSELRKWARAKPRRAASLRWEAADDSWRLNCWQRPSASVLEKRLIWTAHDSDLGGLLGKFEAWLRGATV